MRLPPSESNSINISHESLGHEIATFRKQLKNVPDHDPLMKGDYRSVNPEKLAAISPSLEDVEKRVPLLNDEMLQAQNYIQMKITENKYLKNMYRIKPGEKYSIRKDLKNSLQKGLAKPHWKSSFFQDLSKKSPPADTVLNAQKISPMVKIFTADSNANARHVTNSNPTPFRKTEIYIPSRAPRDVYKNSAISSDAYPTIHKPASGVNTQEPISTVKKEVDAMELNAAERRDRPGPLLLWSMRVQMKHLHELDPDHWTPHILSYIFLVPEEKVKMVLKSRWYPSNEVEAAEYDKLILQNWKKFSKVDRTFSVALAKKAIEKRLEEHKKGVSGVPAVPGQHEVQLQNLIFEEPLEAHCQGVVPRAAAKPRPSGNGGEWVNIIRGYKCALEHLNSCSGSIEGNSTPGAKRALATIPNKVTIDSRHIGEIALEAKQKRQNRKKQELVTLEEFVKNKSSTKKRSALQNGKVK
ncbi:hypothetical protein FHG87_012415 [Trinorchestia longiramus]|nr:hypothetical protein FHG87_012415 [Trinorchestia longiramus]